MDDSERIWCLGLIWELASIIKYNLENNTGSYYIEVFDYDLKQLFFHEFFFSPFDPDSFYKIVFLRDQICLMLIYNYNSLNIQIPSFLTIYITSDNKIMNYTNPGKIDIDYSPSIKFNSNCLLNDLIKISKYKASFTSVNTEKEKLYISIIEVYEIEKVIYKLYEIELYNLYHYKFLFDMRQYLYLQQHITFGFSFCQNSDCDETSDKHYSAFLIFGYPNSTNGYLNLTEYFENNPNSKIEDITIDLKENINIENNIFGYVYSYIKISDLVECENITIYSTKEDNPIIATNYQLLKEERIKLGFKGNKYQSFNCSIYFRYTVTEAEYTEHQQYYIYSYQTNSNHNFAQDFNNHKYNYEGKESYYNIIFDYKEPIYTTIISSEEYKTDTVLLPNSLINQEKEIASSEQITANIKSTKEITSIVTNKKTEKIIPEKVETTEIKKIETIIVPEITNIKEITQKIKETSRSNTEEKTCTKDEVLNGECGNGVIQIVQVKEIFNIFKENVHSFNYPEEKMQVIQTQNVVFQIIILNAQDLANGNVSFVDIGECEKILKTIYHINESDSLIMVKSDFKNNDSYSTNVQFDLYHPYSKEKLNMSYCDDVQIKINVPSELENNTIDLYKSLLESGYNLFDSNDSFYTDVCSTYTSENGTDMILSDRQNIIFSLSGNITLCQLGCNFIYYNKTLKMAECDCSIQSTSTETDAEKFNEKELKNSFASTILNSNFIILKCIKLAFSFEHIFTNKGRIAMTIIIFFFIIILLIFFIYDKNTLNKYFKSILKNKNKEEDVEINDLSKNNDKVKDKAKNNDISIYQNRRSANLENTNRNMKISMTEKHKMINLQKINHNKFNFDNTITNSDKKILKFEEGKNNFPPKRNAFKTNTHKFNIRNSFNFFNSIIRSSKDELNKINIISEEKMKERLKIEEEKNQILKEKNKSKNPDIKIKTNIKKDNNPIKETKDSEIYKDMNDDELNSLEYDKALVYDKRTFFQYYWSLLKKDNLILFTFLPTNDYNLISLKMTLFILSISLETTINAFFFTDETMHQIHQNNGEFDLIYQIPQILYSSIISTILNSLLQKLALSEDSFLTLKRIKNYDKVVKDYENIRKCLIVKFIIFIVISFILMLFCWYYISIFCAVYINTQSILLKDILLSLLLSMIYPFGLCLLPGLCRIPALQAENKDKKCLYKFSGFVELI